jgi:hypothetical protein
VHLSTLIFSIGAKLASFYLGVAAVLWVLWRERRTMLFILVAAGLPLFLFAIVLFEPSSPERFLPLFPFAFLAFAMVLSRKWRRDIPSACIMILLAGSTAFNLADGIRGGSPDAFAETRERIRALKSNVQPGSLVMVVTFNDDLFSLPGANPLDKSLASSRFQVKDLIVLANRNNSRWRSAFAARTLKHMQEGKEVWLSERLFARRPESRWLWVEGDDRKVRWADVPALFGQLETELKVQAGGDGFLRLAPTEANRDRLAKVVAAESAPASF